MKKSKNTKINYLKMYSLYLKEHFLNVNFDRKNMEKISMIITCDEKLYFVCSKVVQLCDLYRVETIPPEYTRQVIVERLIVCSKFNIWQAARHRVLYKRNRDLLTNRF